MAIVEGTAATVEGMVATAMAWRQHNGIGGNGNSNGGNKIITTVTVAAVEVTTKTAEGTDNNQLKR